MSKLLSGKVPSPQQGDFHRGGVPGVLLPSLILGFIPADILNLVIFLS